MLVTRPDELGQAEIDAWRAMQGATAALGNPFLSPEFAIAAARFRPAARVAVLAGARSAKGFFPFERHRFGIGAPVCGWLSLGQGLIHAPGVEWDSQELLRGCGLAVWQFDHLVAGQQPFLPYQEATAPSPVIDLADGFAAYYARLRARAPQFCRELERKARKLARDAGELHFVADSRDPSVLRALMTWKSQQYHRTGLVDRFGLPWVTGLLETLLATRGDHLSGMLSGLYADGQLVAAQFGLRSGKLFAGWFTAYADRFGRYSPGLIQVLRLAEALAGAGVELIDMGKGPAAYKEKLKDCDNVVAEGIVTGRSALAAVHRARRASARWAGVTLSRHPRLYRATRPFRTARRR